MARYVGKRIVPKHCGYWDNTKSYEMENIVYDRTSGNSYISRKAVPAGTDISQEEYWALCSDFNMQMDLLEKHFTATEQRIVADNDATEQAIRQDNANTKNQINESLQHTTEELTGTVNQAKNAMTEQKASFDQTAEDLNTRMDAVLAAGTGTGETEILDARVDAEGREHATLGEAIRSSETRTAERLGAVGDAIGDIIEVDFSMRSGINAIISASSGKWTTGGTRRTFMIPVPEMTAQITVKANDDAVSVIALLKSNSCISGELPDYATGGSRITIPVGGTLTMDVPSDCKYVAIMKSYEEIEHTPVRSAFVIYRRTPVIDDTLTVEGAGADAKAVGEKLSEASDLHLYDEIYDLKKATIYGAFVTTSNKWSISGDRHSYVFEAPKHAKELTITAGENGTVIGFWKDIDFIETSQVTPHYASGETRRFVEAFETGTFEIPDDCTHICLSKDFQEREFTPVSTELKYFLDTPHVDETLSVSGEAADAKVTGDKIERINSLLHKEIPYDLTAASVVKGFIVVSTKWTVGSDRRSYIFERPEGSEKITVTAGENGVALGLWRSKDFISENQVAIDWAEGETRRYVNAGETNTYDIPDDCAFICVAKEFQGVDHAPVALSFYTLSLWDDSPKYKPIPLGLHEMPENEGVLNVIKRCRQLTDIKWTPAVDLPRLMLVQRNGLIPESASGQNYQGVFKAGVEYKGVPYGRCNSVMKEYGYSYAFVGSYIGFDTFISSIMNPKSKLSLESQYKISNHETTIYAAVCSALTSYALGVSYRATSSIPSIPGLELIGKINDDGVLLDQANIKLGDCLDLGGDHTAMITDIVRDSEGNIQIVEISDASTAGLADRNYADGQVGGLCRRKGWTVDQFYGSWGKYNLYRYAHIANVPYTPSPYVNVGDEPDMFRIEHFPVMPYEGENFTYKSGSIPGDIVKLVINLSGYGFLRVFKDGEEIENSPYTVSSDTESVDIETIEPGEYSAYLCNMSGEDVTNMTAACHWKVQ